MRRGVIWLVGLDPAEGHERKAADQRKLRASLRDLTWFAFYASPLFFRKGT